MVGVLDLGIRGFGVQFRIQGFEFPSLTNSFPSVLSSSSMFGFDSP